MKDMENPHAIKSRGPQRESAEGRAGAPSGNPLRADRNGGHNVRYQDNIRTSQRQRTA